MEWNVFYYDINKRKMDTFNIFDHCSFRKDVEGLKIYKSKEEFANRLKSILLYYFWSKSEWEVIISPWCGGDINDGIKVDVYTQVMNNWDIFVDYVYDNYNNNCNKEN